MLYCFYWSLGCTPGADHWLEEVDRVDRIVFLGSGGARIIMANQTLATGGIWLQLADTQISVDPGPGALVYACKHQLDPTKLSAIFLSHRHLDHCGDVNAMIEAKTRGGFLPGGRLYAPADALDKDPVVLRYLRPYLREIVVLKPATSYQLGNLRFMTSMAHRHGEVETYGCIWDNGRFTLGYLPDTAYFPELTTFYQASILIISMLRMESHPRVDHLAFNEVLHMLQELSPQICLLTHFGSQVYQADPLQVADNMSQSTGRRVIAAQDGLEINLDQLLGLEV